MLIECIPVPSVLRLGRGLEATCDIKPHVQACSVMFYLYREEQLTSLQSGEEYDVLVIGGGATGVGVALDATTRGTYIHVHVWTNTAHMHSSHGRIQRTRCNLHRTQPFTETSYTATLY